jgi:hypothetical protein
MSPPRRTLTEAETTAIANEIVAQLKPFLAPPPLHEMTLEERNDYATEAWARAGIIPIRPDAGRTISEWLSK